MLPPDGDDDGRAAAAATAIQSRSRGKAVRRDQEAAKKAGCARKLQSRTRGHLARKELNGAEEAMEAHVDVLEEMEGAQAEKQNQMGQFAEFESLIGQDEQREYLRELESKKNAQLKKIEELKSGRYYLSSAEQRHVSRELSRLQEQLARTQHECILVRHGGDVSKMEKSEAAATPSSKKKRLSKDSSKPTKLTKGSSSSKRAAAPASAPAASAVLGENKDDPGAVQKMLWSFLRACNQKEKEQEETRLQTAVHGVIHGSTVRAHCTLQRKGAAVSTHRLGAMKTRVQLVPQDSARAATARIVLLPAATTGPVRVELAAMSFFQEHQEREKAAAAKERDEEAKREAKERTERLEAAKMHPLGREAAIRTTLLQTEMWKVNPSAATQHVRELRSNINQLDLQIRLTERAKERLEREIKFPSMRRVKAAASARKLQDEEAKLHMRKGLLDTYRTMLVATRDVLQHEVKQTGRTVLRRAMKAKLLNDALEEKKRQAAITVQKAWRTRMSRRRVTRMAEAARMRKLENIREKNRQKARGLWGSLKSVMTTASDVKRRAAAIVIIQRAARERQWQKEALEKAKSDLMETDKKQAKQAQTLTALRLGPQRVRLVDREHAHRENIRNIQLSTNRSAIMHIVETEEERDARIAMLEEHTHRAAMAAQKQNLTPKPPVEAEPAKQKPLRVPEWMHDRMADPKAARPTTAPHAARMCYSSPRAEGLTPRPPSSARQRPRPPNSTRASRPPTAASARPGSAVALPERPASDLEVVTGAALRRQLYVQTPTARDVIDGAAVEALRPCVDRMASQVTSEAVGGSGAKAALALAQRVCMEPPSRTPKVEKLDRGSASVFYNPRVHPEPDNSTARVAAVWNDSSLNASKAKEQKANLRTWHAHRHAWKRSSGLRKTVLLIEEKRANTLARWQLRDLESLFARMCYWQREDDAALAMQAAWRSFVLQRKQRRQLDITLRLSGIVKDTSSTVEGTVSVAAEKLHRRLFGAAIPPVSFRKPTAPTAAKLEARVEARERRKPKAPQPTCVWVELEEVASETYFTDMVSAMMWGLTESMKPIEKKAREEAKREGAPAAEGGEGPPSRMVSAGLRHVA